MFSDTPCVYGYLAGITIDVSSNSNMQFLGNYNVMLDCAEQALLDDNVFATVMTSPYEPVLISAPPPTCDKVRPPDDDTPVHVVPHTGFMTCFLKGTGTIRKSLISERIDLVRNRHQSGHRNF